MAQSGIGEVNQVQTFPAKSVVNTDLQAAIPCITKLCRAAVLPRGQENAAALRRIYWCQTSRSASQFVTVPDHRILAKQDYEREHRLWSQGISAKQDYQRAYNTYPNVQVQAVRSRLSAFGASSGSNGRYIFNWHRSVVDQ